MDDANVPSLLALPYLGYCNAEDPIYQNTRNFILSFENPYYYQGKMAKGIGSPHTPKNYIWHISLAIQGMTALTNEEKEEILELFKNTDANTNFMHEGFHVDEPDQFTRPWFSWANSMFSEFLLTQCHLFVKGSPLANV
jgi:meiotically up-regulated gene 157 (Mug157) protein